MLNFNFSKIKYLRGYVIVAVLAYFSFSLILKYEASGDEIVSVETSKQEVSVGSYDYDSWVNEVFKQEEDLDEDGLLNKEEFVLKTNPALSDTDKDGLEDGIEVLNSSSPSGSGDLQHEILESLNLVNLSNRINFYTGQKYLQKKKDIVVTGPNFDLSQNGVLFIPRLNIRTPLVWTKDVTTMDNDLTKGVIHYPGSSLPGEKGIMYVSGHSSDYFWKNNAYGRIFRNINDLQFEDKLYIFITDKTGNQLSYEYRVSAKNIYKPDDPDQFSGNEKSVINLATCWPVGSQKERYVVSATLVK